jgi:nicotinate-nucleotide adenylyltransferase
MPTAQPPHKSPVGIASAADRLEMCRLAVAGNQRFEVDDREIVRGGASYTIDTVRQLRQSGWESVHWLIGADMVNILPTWRLAHDLLPEVHFVIMARPGWNFDFHILPPEFLVLQNNVVEVPQIDISATEIRRRVGAGLAIDFLTPPAVVSHIDQKKLYRNPA